MKNSIGDENTILKAVILREFGGPENLQFEDIPNPDPKPGEIRVKIKAIGLNRAEVATRVGKYLLTKDLPVRLGMEGAGVVDALGEGVSEFAVGDRVAVVPEGKFQASQGTYSEFVNYPANRIARTPDILSDEEASATWMAYLTAWAAIIKQAGGKAGENCIVTAASSSLGIPAFQILKREGMTSIAVTRSTEKVAALKSGGSDFVIDTSKEDLKERVKEITAGKGADIAFDAVGGPGMKALITAMNFGGRIITYGLLDSRPVELSPWWLLSKQISIMGHMIFLAIADDSVRREGVEYITSGIESGVFKPLIAKIFDFDKIADAHRFMQSNQQIGKIVVRV
ncbi:MAG: zinc-dependent alcohol dehydrogenase family protein [candidate division Zixibacteria bacterium]|nr:zinc-dependent alcohol dehydrogenase family protein [candidate division Zixibacteria bacterium]